MTKRPSAARFDRLTTVSCLAGLLVLGACATATIEDAVPTAADLAQQQPAAGQAAAATAGAGTPRTFTDAEVAERTRELQQAAGSAGSGGGGSDADAVRRRALANQNEVLRRIEATQ